MTTTPTTTRDRERAGLSVSDGGMETVLIFEYGFDLPEFAAFTLLDHDDGRQALREYYRGFADIAARHGVELVLDTATWRASRGWGTKLGYDAADLDRVNRDAVDLVAEIRDAHPSGAPRIWISGSVGPAGDGYRADVQLTIPEATAYHEPQIVTLADAGADVVTALTMTYTDEAVGLALAAKAAGIGVIVSFTVETDGALPSGQTLQEAIETVDLLTDGYPDGYGVNCAHPTHFAARLSAEEPWCRRIQIIQANASSRSHEELDEAPDLDPGDPSDLAVQLAALRERLPGLTMVGGCCGTSHVHIDEIARACARDAVDADTRDPAGISSGR